MDIVSAFTTALATANSARSLISSAIDARDDTKRRAALAEANEQIFELVGKLMGAQLAQSELVQTKAALEARVAELEAHQRQAERYELQELASGALVYAYKEGVQPSEPPHRICPRCWDVDQKKSILQPGFNDRLSCPQCQKGFPLKKPEPRRGGPGPSGPHGWMAT